MTAKSESAEHLNHHTRLILELKEKNRAIETERDGYRAALKASAEFFASDTHEHCCVAMDEVQAKVRAALDGEGKP